MKMDEMNTNEVAVEKKEAVREEQKAHDLRISPMARIAEGEAGYGIWLDMPGVSEKAVKISVEDQVLRVDAIREDLPESLGNLIREDMPVADYHVAYEIPDRVDVERISAKLANGVLAVTLPKREEARSRRILVNVA